MKNAIGLILFGVAGYFLYEWWKNQSANPNGPLLPAGTTLPSGTQQPTGGNTGTVSVLLHDDNGSSVFNVGDSFTLTVTGPSNSPVMITASQNGGPNGTVQLGTTDSNGTFVYRDSWVVANVGNWVETIMVGGIAGPPLNFDIQPITVPIQAPQITRGMSLSGIPLSSMINIPSRSLNTGIGNQHLPYDIGYAGHGIGLEGGEGLGRSYNSGFGIIGRGYGINETLDGDASRYEMVNKWIM